MSDSESKNKGEEREQISSTSSLPAEGASTSGCSSGCSGHNNRQPQANVGIRERRVRSFSECPTCHAVFRYQSQFIVHMKVVHNQNRPFNCNRCDKKFQTRSHLKRHINTHTTRRLFTCPYCQRRYIRAVAFRDHKNLHTGAKPYYCPECPSRFPSRRKMSYHLRINHYSQSSSEESSPAVQEAIGSSVCIQGSSSRNSEPVGSSSVQNSTRNDLNEGEMAKSALSSNITVNDNKGSESAGPISVQNIASKDHQRRDTVGPLFVQNTRNGTPERESASPMRDQNNTSYDLQEGKQNQLSHNIAINDLQERDSAGSACIQNIAINDPQGNASVGRAYVPNPDRNDFQGGDSMGSMHLHNSTITDGFQRGDSVGSVCVQNATINSPREGESASPEHGQNVSGNIPYEGESMDFAYDENNPYGDESMGFAYAENNSGNNPEVDNPINTVVQQVIVALPSEIRVVQPTDWQTRLILPFNATLPSHQSSTLNALPSQVRLLRLNETMGYPAPSTSYQPFHLPG